MVGLERVPGDLEIAASPTLVLRSDRSATLALSLVTAVAAGLAIGVGTCLVSTRGASTDVSRSGMAQYLACRLARLLGSP